MTDTGDSAVDRPTESSGRRSDRHATRSDGGRPGRRTVGLGAIIALGVLAAFVIWLVVDSRGESSTPESEGSSVAIVSKSGAKTLAGALTQPVYWLGSLPDTQIEFTQLRNGRIYVRYLPPDAKAGDKGTFLTVATYPVRNAYNVVLKGSKESGAVPVKVAGGAGLYHKANPLSVYLAYPGSNDQIEVYSPESGTAQALVESGRVAPIVNKGAGANGPSGATAAELKALSARLGHPIYWAGAQPKVTYELTQTANGRVYVRYLPRGVPVGASAAYRTVGTYPLPNAFAVTKSAGKAKDSTSVVLPDGAVAIYKTKNSTHVYLAYPGSDQQIEVFDPTPDAARRLVAAASIAPVR